MDLKPKYPRLIPLHTLLGHQRRIHLKKDILKGSAEISAVDSGVARGFGVVDILAFPAVEFHGLGLGDVGEAGGEERVGEAGDAGAFAEVGFFVLF